MTTDSATPSPVRRYLALALVGVIGGALSGAFGVGGGIVMVPLLIWLAGLDQRHAAATSLVAILPTAIAGAASYFAQGEVNVLAGLLIAAGGIVGSIIGTRLLKKLPIGWLRWLFIALLLAVAVQTILEPPARGVDLELTTWTIVSLVGLGVAMAMVAAIALLTPERNYLYLLPALLVWGATLPICFQPAMRIVMNAVPAESQGQASGLCTAVRMFGATLGMAFASLTLSLTDTSYQAVFAMTAALMAVVLALAILTISEKSEQTEASAH